VISAFLAVCVVLPQSAASASREGDPSSETDVKQAKRVDVGIFVNQLLDLNFREDYFIVDFWLWYRWESDRPGEFSLKKQDNGEDYNFVENCEVINGEIKDKIGYLREQKDGFTYENVRMIAKIVHRFNMRSYPLDQHRITIAIEDQNNRLDKLVYNADVASSGRSEHLTVPGWTVSAEDPRITVNTYKTNFGNEELASNHESKYTQFNYTIELRKPILLSLIKTLWPTLLAVLLAIIGLFLPAQSATRFEMGLGAVLAIAANKLAITSSVQDIAQFGFADLVQIVSGFVVFSMLLESVIAKRCFDRNAQYAGFFAKCDLRFAFALLAGYLLCIAVLTLAYT
jgi:hypothetical protein